MTDIELKFETDPQKHLEHLMILHKIIQNTDLQGFDQNNYNSHFSAVLLALHSYSEVLLLYKSAIYFFLLVRNVF